MAPGTEENWGIELTTITVGLLKALQERRCEQEFAAEFDKKNQGEVAQKDKPLLFYFYFFGLLELAKRISVLDRE